MFLIKAMLIALFALLALLVEIDALFGIERDKDCKSEEKVPCQSNRNCCDPMFCYGKPGEKHCKTLSQEEFDEVSKAYWQNVDKANARAKKCPTKGDKCKPGEKCCSDQLVCYSSTGKDEDLKCKVKVYKASPQPVQEEVVYIFEDFTKIKKCLTEDEPCDLAGDKCCGKMTCNRDHKQQLRCG